MVEKIDAKEVMAYCHSVLGLELDDGAVNQDFLIALVRRAAGALCPCSPATLRSSLVESLVHLEVGNDDLPDTLEKLIHDLIVSGDLLELVDATHGNDNVRGTEVFAAPPSFVKRKNGRVFVIGIVKDHDKFLPDDLMSRVVHGHCTRYIVPENDEDLSKILIGEGFNEVQENDWLKGPRPKSADKLYEEARQKLSQQPQEAPIAELKILDPTKKPTYYNGRWTSPKDQTGMFVARRPREFGADIWCLVELESGLMKRIVDLPLETNRWVGRDDAWHIQMAIDHRNGQPQRYRVSNTNKGCRLEFFSPLPTWAERRLVMFGRKHDMKTKGSLFAYDLPAEEIDEETRFLRERLWLAPHDDGKVD